MLNFSICQFVVFFMLLPVFAEDFYDSVLLVLNKSNRFQTWAVIWREIKKKNTMHCLYFFDRKQQKLQQ